MSVYKSSARGNRGSSEPYTYSKKTIGGQGCLLSLGSSFQDVSYANQLSQYSSYNPWINPPHSQILHPILFCLCRPHLQLAPIPWFWLSYGHGRPWPYEGGNFLPLYQGNWYSRNSPTLFSPCFSTVWVALQADLWSGTTILLHLHLGTCSTPPIQCHPLHHLSSPDQWVNGMGKPGVRDLSSAVHD